MALKVWYRLGGTLDSSGNNLTLTGANSPGVTRGALGEVNGASTYNGNTSAPQYHIRSAATALSVTDNFSLSAKIHPTAYQSTNYFGLQNGIMAKGPATTYNWSMQVSSATSVAFCKRTGAESLIFRTFTGLPTLTNTWTTVTMVITGGNVSLYLNGAYNSQQAISNIAPGASDNLFVGAMAGGTGTAVTSFTGYLDDVRMYDHALSVDEIRLIHQQGESASLNFFNAF